MICSSKKQSTRSKNKFKIRSQKVLRLNTNQRSTDNQPTQQFKISRKASRARINTLNFIQNQSKVRHRKYTQIYNQESPQLSPLKKLTICKQYQTKLKMSGQSWVIYDTLKNQYKRGYKPNTIKKFNGLQRFLVLAVYCLLIQKNDQFKKLRFLINPNNLNQNKIKYLNKKQQQILLRKKKIKNHLNKGSIIYFPDLIKCMIISGSEQFFEYSLLVCGFIIQKFQSKLILLINKYIIIQQGKQEYFNQTFCKFISTNILQKINDIKDTKIQIQQKKCELTSTANQIAIIFLYCLDTYKSFKQIIIVQKLKTYYKYQVGFNYWQDRVFNIKNKILTQNSNHYCNLSFKGKQNFDILCLNHTLNILMIIENSKFSMGDLDISVLQNWVQNVTRNIGNQRKSSVFLSPNKNKKSTLPLILITNN